MKLFFFKLILTPLLIALTTLVMRRWGPVVGGWLVGLPLTSGPISVFLALEEGRSFAASSAMGTLISITAIVIFCLIYSRSASKLSWPAAITISLLGYFATIYLISFITWPLIPSTLVTIAFICFALFIEGPIPSKIIPIPSPWWDIPFRMITATAIVLAITGFSSSLGAHWSGLLSSFPAFVCVMIIFSHILSGPESVRQFAHGVITGTFTVVAFFCVVHLTIEHTNLVLSYSLACVAASLMNIAIMVVISYIHTRQKNKSHI